MVGRNRSSRGCCQTLPRQQEGEPSWAGLELTTTTLVRDSCVITLCYTANWLSTPIESWNHSTTMDNKSYISDNGVGQKPHFFHDCMTCTHLQHCCGKMPLYKALNLEHWPVVIGTLEPQSHRVAVSVLVLQVLCTAQTLEATVDHDG